MYPPRPKFNADSIGAPLVVGKQAVFDISVTDLTDDAAGAERAVSLLPPEPTPPDLLPEPPTPLRDIGTYRAALRRRREVGVVDDAAEWRSTACRVAAGSCAGTADCLDSAHRPNYSTDEPRRTTTRRLDVG